MKQWTLPQIVEEAKRRGRPVSKEHLRQLCVRGELKATKPGRDWLVPDWAAQDWLEKWLAEK